MNKKLIREVRDIAKKRLDDERLVNDYNFYSTTKKKYDSFNDFFNKSENEDFIFSCYEFFLRREPNIYELKTNVDLLKQKKTNRKVWFNNLLTSKEGSKFKFNSFFVQKKFFKRNIIQHFLAWLINLGKHKKLEAELNTQNQRLYRLENIITQTNDYLYSLNFTTDKPLNRNNYGLSSDFLNELFIKLDREFRGDIEDKLKIYLPIIKKYTKNSKLPFLDLGCGNADLIRMVSNIGIKSIGVDRNYSQLKKSSNDKFSVIDEDALNYLKLNKNSSFSVISLIHIVEHLDFNYLMALLVEINRVLKKNGLLIVETPNPESLRSLHSWFYLDPTHKNPIGKALMDLILRHVGFSVINLELDRKITDKNFKLKDISNDLDLVVNSNPDYALLAIKK